MLYLRQRRLSLQLEKLAGASVLITGASKGIGRSIALRLARVARGVIAVGRDERDLVSLASEAPAGIVTTIAGDICDPATRNRILNQVCEVRDLQIVINNAGTSLFRSFADQTERDIRNLIEVNLIAPMLLTQALIPVLAAQPRAEVIQVGSTYGRLGHPGYTTYCASKAGLCLFSEALERELADTSIRVRMFSPRGTRTAINSSAAVALMQSMGQEFDSVDDVADQFMHFLASNRTEWQVGRPERFFVWLNQSLPGIVRHSLVSRLPKIRHYLQEGLH